MRERWFFLWFWENHEFQDQDLKKIVKRRRTEQLAVWFGVAVIVLLILWFLIKNPPNGIALPLG